jgi:hypothetical protein
MSGLRIVDQLTIRSKPIVILVEDDQALIPQPTQQSKCSISLIIKCATHLNQRMQPILATTVANRAPIGG